MWAVMKAYGWNSIEIPGVNIIPPPNGPQRFIPLFDTRKQALAFTDGDESNLQEMETFQTPAIVPFKSTRKWGKSRRG